jgi:hypothetical protein
MLQWFFVAFHLLAEASAARRDVRVRFLMAQIEILRRKLGGNRVIPSPDDRAKLLSIGQELDHNALTEKKTSSFIKPGSSNAMTPALSVTWTMPLTVVSSTSGTPRPVWASTTLMRKGRAEAGGSSAETEARATPKAMSAERIVGAKQFSDT